MSTYDYPTSGNYSETRATLDDGRVVTVDCQYAVVLPHSHLGPDCTMLTTMGGRCTCGACDGIDIPALIADARVNGKFGRPPVAPETEEHRARREQELREYDAAAARIERTMMAGETI